VWTAHALLALGIEDLVASMRPGRDGDILDALAEDEGAMHAPRRASNVPAGGENCRYCARSVVPTSVAPASRYSVTLLFRHTVPERYAPGGNRPGAARRRAGLDGLVDGRVSRSSHRRRRVVADAEDAGAARPAPGRGRCSGRSRRQEARTHCTGRESSSEVHKLSCDHLAAMAWLQSFDFPAGAIAPPEERVRGLVVRDLHGGAVQRSIWLGQRSATVPEERAP